MKTSPAPVTMYLPPSKGRSLGIHVSGIIRCIAVEMGILKPEWAEDLDLYDAREITDPTSIIRIAIGLAWENWYISNILVPTGVKKHPGELKLDNVSLSPDGIAYQPHTVIHEVKATYKGDKTLKPIEGQWMWMSQIKSYCKAAYTLYARLHILQLCGDYKFPLRPKVTGWDFEFTQRELDENWNTLMEYKEWKK